MTYPTCSRCGGWMDRVFCEECGGEGTTAPGELHDTDPLWYRPDDVQPCHMCDGEGTWWACSNGPDWCESHPLAERA